MVDVHEKHRARSERGNERHPVLHRQRDARPTEIEGSAGGLAFACLGSWAAFHLLVPLGGRPNAPVWGWLAYGLLVGTAGMLGDLAESLLKRDLGRKDSSTWMPGFGGLLDVLDSILLAAPVAYLCWAFEMV